MEPNLREFLEKDETVLWQGEPEPMPLVENGNKTSVLCTWLVTAVIFGGLLAAYVSQNPQWSGAVAVAMVVIASVIILSPFYERLCVTRQKYYITNKRAILAYDSRTFYAMDLSEIDDFKVVHELSNEDSLVLGSKLFEEAGKQLRWRAAHPLLDRNHTGARIHAEAMVFYGIKNVGSAVDLLEGYDTKPFV